MAHQGYDLQLIAYGGRYWRANFLPDRNRALDRERHGLGADALAAVQWAAWARRGHAR
jgi:hypothetical protein